MTEVKSAAGWERLLELHRAEGAFMGEVDGVPLPRHYGDPAGEYAAATGEGAVLDRSHRSLLFVRGRAPAQMLTGIVSGSMPPDPAEAEPGMWRGRSHYSTVLTPKGKVVTDLRLFRLEAGAEGAHLMDVPRAGVQGLMEHLKRYLPPRMAKVKDPDDPLGLLTVVGARAASLLSREALGLRVDTSELETLEEGEERILADGSPTGIRVVRSGTVAPPAFDVLAPAEVLRSLWRRLRESGLRPAGSGVWDTLRVEQGRPAFGQELDRDTLLAEAGVVSRAVDHRKGCYTGQEVIVRIRDRGRVNRHLRGVFLGDLPTPAPGTPLFVEGRDRAGGEIRSTAQSPRFGQGIALAYLRREAEPPTTARLGAANGPDVEIRALSDKGWELVEGDPGS